MGVGGVSAGGRATPLARSRGLRGRRSSVFSLPLVRARLRSRAAPQRSRGPPLVLAVPQASSQDDATRSWLIVASPAVFLVSNASVLSTRDHFLSMRLHVMPACWLLPARHRAVWWMQFTASELVSSNRVTFWRKKKGRCSASSSPNFPPVGSRQRATSVCAEMERAVE